MSSSNLTLGSLFDGIAGFPYAAEKLGIKTVWTSEIERAPCDISKLNFPEAIQLGDVTKINGAEIPPVDIISFGSPCQDLSVAGQGAGLDGARLSVWVVRRLTPTECERLQGFPDDWTKYDTYGIQIKDTPRYAALGNSIAIPCALRVFKGILDVEGR